ncbi:uncharacterized protein TEOVI_000414900 [Trypanosoma equiperdum]|uniref:MATH domain-containing protein n=3 Tax=Trypanozoon TaxID=39700 RepID=Q585A4_TRYB2|nr:hypothetical protein, conserved [Trypanosoma brucei gambiense DAL972]XP_845265.1 hypothetical protein, conserved [Trypanosoma brucei brucei TREU927]AAX80397.1 hypothetical protein, conserved [Trypanosoma brucei]SCU72572.1 hypothetical protein, conserved [Trypanosoma equiperdum]AAZ11706.1 hypothetical protein, conserved [Trypanosoma brucei brucei TREU927]CBH11629.1 hypothetical protein, conserved [Trypanosoma brucei gambiense DAL972]|eukprot:XP_011773914.1 hypothetical protein, conserved [Trypanosoma brucei gambiense DAL972]
MDPQYSQPLLAPEDQDFYRSILHRLAHESPIRGSTGLDMTLALEKELIRAQENNDSEEYKNVIWGMLKPLVDSLMSAAHRAAPYTYFDNVAPREYPVTRDEEEYFKTDSIFDSDEERGGDDDFDGGSKPMLREQEQSLRKKEELRKKREDDETMLIEQKKVVDDKGTVLNTVGPFAPPRLTVRATTYTFPSRRSLEQRTVPPPAESSSGEDEAGDEEAANVDVTSLCSSGSGEAVSHLTSFMEPLSNDSLKKMSESAKVKVKPSSSNREYIVQIVKTAVRLGCEKACALIDKHKFIEDMTNRVQTGPLQTAASIDFLQSLPEQLKHALSHMLGLWEESPQVEEMWERMVAMGFLAVLTNLRLKPLKRITSELGVSVPDTNSTEKFCEAIVFAAFPRERVRARKSRSKRQKTLAFTVPPSLMRCKGDMGFITFQVENISLLPKDSERRYSPEFEFGQMKWSLLCMANKSNLALYLCQTETVYCKFLISVINHLSKDDSICNEGTQRFFARSQENDWGFNNVARFDELLNPRKGFWHKENDSITIEVGIVIVEAPKTTVSSKNVSNKDKPAGPKVDERAVRQLIEDEKIAQLKKRVKQEISKTLKDEEKTRKDTVQRATKGFHDILERFKSEKQRIVRELAERERREQLERQREQEIIKQAQEQNAEMARGIEEMKRTITNLAREKKELTHDIKELKKAGEKLANELNVIAERKATLLKKIRSYETKISEGQHHLEELQQDPVLSFPVGGESDGIDEIVSAQLQDILERLS